MNDSGTALRDLCSFYKVMTSTDLLVIVDDADLPLGKLRLRARGSAGGHNGLKSIIAHFGTVEFPRLRVGVGRQAGELKNHVLGRFSVDERAQIDAAVKRAADAAELFAKENILAAMNRFNAAQVDEDQA
jgi:PTH1 family peptidyl-tRNA hydrolase